MLCDNHRLGLIVAVTVSAGTLDLIIDITVYVLLIFNCGAADVTRSVFDREPTTLSSSAEVAGERELEMLKLCPRLSVSSGCGMRLRCVTYVVILFVYNKQPRTLKREAFIGEKLEYQTLHPWFVLKHSLK